MEKEVMVKVKCYVVQKSGNNRRIEMPSDCHERYARSVDPITGVITLTPVFLSYELTKKTEDG